MQNPLVTHMHDVSDPIGHTVELKRTDGGLRAKMKLGRKSRAKAVWMDVEDEILRTLSIGFDPVHKSIEPDGDDGWVLNEIEELYEFAIIPLPSNTGATIDALKGFGIELPEPTWHSVKAVVPFASMTKAPEETPWRWDPAAQNAILGEDEDWARYRKAHAWYDAGNAEAKGAYKLPHHKLIGGEMQTVWRGVATAMAALLGARGGADLPESDRRGVYGHLGKHYDEFEKEPPEFKGVGLDEVEPDDWPAFADVTFKNDEPELYAEAEAYGDLAAADRIATRTGNILRHWEKDGRKLSPELVAALRDTQAAYGDLPVVAPESDVEAQLREILGTDDALPAVRRLRDEHAALGVR
jgi:HK97 family phage prohead protease